MINALQLDQMTTRARYADPDDHRVMAQDVITLALEVRRLNSVVASVQELADRKMEASSNYNNEALLGRVTRNYGFAMSNKLKREAYDLGRLLN